MSPHEPRSDDVESLYRDYIARNAGPERVDFEAFCAEHQALAPELRRLHATRTPDPKTKVIPRLEKLTGRDEQNRPPSHGRGSSNEPQPSRYRLEGEIARGGMGAILKVWDTDLHRALAMKVILGEEELRIDDGSTAEIRLSRFLEEAQITGQLDHPGVVPVHELGVDKGGRVYFTMRLVKGRDLGEIINKSRSGEDGWSLTRALNVLHRVCETMAYAHTKGVVHRDLKPENIMVGQFGETYAMDWGLARVLGKPDGEAQRRRLLANSVASFVQTDRHGQAVESDPGSRTQAGAILGTPYYMPPEQAAGELETIGPQSDVYAVGAILYHLLTGKRPYEEVPRTTALSVVRAVIEGPPIAVTRLDPKVPAELVAICERAMERSPEDRYPSMVAMGADLQAYLENRVVHAYQSGAVAEFFKWVRRNRGFSAALASLVFVSIVGLAGLAWTQSQKAAAIAVQQQLAHDERNKALASLQKANEEGYLANVMAASASLAAGETAETKRYLAQCVPELRGWEWNHLSLSADASIAVLEPGGGGVRELAIDPAGAHLVSSSANGTVKVWDLTTHREVQAQLERSDVEMRDSVPEVAFLDGGERVVAIGRQRDARVRIWDAASGRLDFQVPLQVPALFAAAVSPRGDQAAIGAPDFSIHLVDLGAIRDLGELGRHADDLRALAFSADGSRLVSGSEDGTIEIWNVAERQKQGNALHVASPVRSLAIALQPELLVAVGLEDGSVLRFAGPSERPLEPLIGHRGAVYALAFDRDGTLLASASFDKTVRIWSTTDSSAAVVLIGHEQPVNCVQFAAGTTLASGSADGTVRVWDVLHNRATVTYRAPVHSFFTAVDCSRDGSRVVVSASRSGTVDVVDAETGALERQLPGPENDSVTALAFAPDGRRFAAAFRQEVSVRIGDVTTGRLGEPMQGHDVSVTAIAWTPDGNTLVSAAEDGTVLAWDAAKLTARREAWIQDPGVTALAMAGDGATVALGTPDGTIHCRELATGNEVRVLAGEGVRVLSLAYAPSGGALAAGYEDGSIRLFAPGSATANVLTGHEKRVNSLRFLPDGTRLVSGSLDGTLRVWDTTTGRLTLALRDHVGPITGVSAGGTAANIVSTSFDGTLCIRHTRRQGG
ncbi:MAG TPA: protein kinase [Planctomycetota bacterium]|nr:protein kinase [Planctomycetota bacterium]